MTTPPNDSSLADAFSNRPRSLADMISGPEADNSLPEPPAAEGNGLDGDVTDLPEQPAAPSPVLDPFSQPTDLPAGPADSLAAEPVPVPEPEAPAPAPEAFPAPTVAPVVDVPVTAEASAVEAPATDPEASVTGPEGADAEPPVTVTSAGAGFAAPALVRPAGQASDGRKLVKNRRLPRKETFHVMVADPDGSLQFFDATHDIGSRMRFRKPKATCAVRTYPDVVCFSMLLIAKKKASQVASKRIEIPHAALSRLARKSKQLTTSAEGTKPVLSTDTKIVVEFERKDYVCDLVRDGNGVVRIEMPAGVDDEVFELGRAETRISLHLYSTKAQRALALNFIGYLGKAGSPMSLTRAASLAMNTALKLPQFAALANAELAEVPPLPGTAYTRALATMETAAFELPVAFFTDQDFTPVGNGRLHVDIDLEHANASTGALVFNITPSEEVKDLYDRIKDHVHLSLNATFHQLLGDEISRIAIDIVLGDIDSHLVERLKETAAQIGRIDFTPTRYQVTPAHHPT